MASYVMAVFFIARAFIVSKKIWQKHSEVMLILFLTLMLTKSRGVQLLFRHTVIFFLVIPKAAESRLLRR